MWAVGLSGVSNDWSSDEDMKCCSEISKNRGGVIERGSLRHSDGMRKPGESVRDSGRGGGGGPDVVTPIMLHGGPEVKSGNSM